MFSEYTLLKTVMLKRLNFTSLPKIWPSGRVAGSQEAKQKAIRDSRQRNKVSTMWPADLRGSLSVVGVPGPRTLKDSLRSGFALIIVPLLFFLVQ